MLFVHTDELQMFYQQLRHSAAATGVLTTFVF